MKEFISERVDGFGNVYRKYKVNKGILEENTGKILTPEEIAEQAKQNELAEIKTYLEKMNPVASALTGDMLTEYQAKQARYIELIK